MVRTLGFTLSGLEPLEVLRRGGMRPHTCFDQITGCCVKNRTVGRKTRLLFCKPTIHITARERVNASR